MRLSVILATWTSTLACDFFCAIHSENISPLPPPLPALRTTENAAAVFVLRVVVCDDVVVFGAACG